MSTKDAAEDPNRTIDWELEVSGQKGCNATRYVCPQVR